MWMRASSLVVLFGLAAPGALAACGVEDENPGGRRPGGPPDAAIGQGDVVAGLRCEDPTFVTATDLRRLDGTELANTYRAAFGDAVASELEPLMRLFGADGVRNDPRQLDPAFGSSQLDAIDRISRRIASLVGAGGEPLRVVAGGCSLEAPVTDVCVSDFVARLGKRLFRRPLREEEKASHVETYRAGGSSNEGFAAVAASMVLAPDFLYHVELGEPGSGDAARFALTSHEVAARVAYLLTDAPPDDALAAAADAGSLRDAATLGAEVDRILQTPLARAKVRRFVSYWLMLERFQGVPAAEAYLAGLDASGLATEMRRELDAFVDHIVYETSGTYKDLLTSRRSFAMTPALSEIHGHAVPRDAAQAMSTDALRMGILLRGPVLADGSTRTHPIVRGTFMLRRIVCNDIPSPSASDFASRDADPFVPDPVKLSSVQTMNTQTAAPSCQGCHASINPFGTVLEAFDNVGRARDKEIVFDAMGVKIAEHPVTISAVVALGTNESVPVASPIELVDALAAGEAAPLCFTRHVYRFYRRQREDTNANCELGAMYRAMQDPEGNILQNIRASVVNVSLAERRVK